MEIPTIKVYRKEDGLSCVINEHEFDAEKYSEKPIRKAKPKTKKVKAEPEAPEAEAQEEPVAPRRRGRPPNRK